MVTLSKEQFPSASNWKSVHSMTILLCGTELVISVWRWMEFGYLDGYPGETRETSGVVSFKTITEGQTEDKIEWERCGGQGLSGHLERKSDRRTSCDGDNLSVSDRCEEPPSSGLRIINISVSLLLLGGLTLPLGPPPTPRPWYSEEDPTHSPPVLFQPGLKERLFWDQLIDDVY